MLAFMVILDELEGVCWIAGARFMIVSSKCWSIGGCALVALGRPIDRGAELELDRITERLEPAQHQSE